MKQVNDYIDELLAKFMDAKTTEAEEKILADYFQNTETVPEKWLMYKELFNSFQTDAYDFNQKELDNLLIPIKSEKAKVVQWWMWLSAACVATIGGLCIWNAQLGYSDHLMSTSQTVMPKEITTTELLETIHLLTDVVNENIIITALPNNEGFSVRTVSNDGESNTYTLKRSDNGSSLELKSQIINF